MRAVSSPFWSPICGQVGPGQWQAGWGASGSPRRPGHTCPRGGGSVPGWGLAHPGHLPPAAGGWGRSSQALCPWDPPPRAPSMGLACSARLHPRVPARLQAPPGSCSDRGSRENLGAEGGQRQEQTGGRLGLCSEGQGSPGGGLCARPSPDPSSPAPSTTPPPPAPVGRTCPRTLGCGRSGPGGHWGHARGRWRGPALNGGCFLEAGRGQGAGRGRGQIRRGQLGAREPEVTETPRLPARGCPDNRRGPAPLPRAAMGWPVPEDAAGQPLAGRSHPGPWAQASLWPGLTRSAGTEGPGVCLPTGHTGSRGGTQAPCPPPPPGCSSQWVAWPQASGEAGRPGPGQHTVMDRGDSPGAGSAQGTWPDRSGLGAWGLPARPGQRLGPGQGRPGSPPARSPSASWRRSGPAPGSPWTRRRSPDSSTPGPRPLCQGGKQSTPARPSPRPPTPPRPGGQAQPDRRGEAQGAGVQGWAAHEEWSRGAGHSATRVPGVACSPPSGRQGSHSWGSLHPGGQRAQPLRSLSEASPSWSAIDSVAALATRDHCHRLGPNSSTSSPPPT